MPGRCVSKYFLASPRVLGRIGSAIKARLPVAAAFSSCAFRTTYKNPGRLPPSTGALSGMGLGGFTKVNALSKDTAGEIFGKVRGGASLPVSGLAAGRAAKDPTLFAAPSRFVRAGKLNIFSTVAGMDE